MEYFVTVTVIGLVAGTLASLLITHGNFGIVGDVTIGVMGALAVGYLLPAMGLTLGGGIVGAVILAVVGSIATLGILRKVRTG